MTKPFRMREVVARIRALLRRVERGAASWRRREPAIALKGLLLDRAARRVTVDGGQVHLTPLEFDLLVALVEEAGTVRSARTSCARCGAGRRASGTRTLDSHIKSLRAKIGAHRVRTVHGVGYAFGDGS